MANTKVTLGAIAIEVPQMTIGQLERIAEWLEAGADIDRTMKSALAHNRRLLVIGFERSEPKFTNEEIDALEATIQDVRDATTAILRIAGLAPTEEAVADPEAAAPEGASPNSSTSYSASSLPDAGTPPN